MTLSGVTPNFSMHSRLFDDLRLPARLPRLVHLDQRGDELHEVLVAGDHDT